MALSVDNARNRSRLLRVNVSKRFQSWALALVVAVLAMLLMRLLLALCIRNSLKRGTTFGQRTRTRPYCCLQKDAEQLLESLSLTLQEMRNFSTNRSQHLVSWMNRIFVKSWLMYQNRVKQQKRYRLLLIVDISKTKHETLSSIEDYKDIAYLRSTMSKVGTRFYR